MLRITSLLALVTCDTCRTALFLPGKYGVILRIWERSRAKFRLGSVLRLLDDSVQVFLKTQHRQSGEG